MAATLTLRYCTSFPICSLEGSHGCSAGRFEVTDARHEMDDAAFRRERLATAVKQLGQRLAELKMLEDDDRRRIAYDQAQEERDKLAKELAAVYPELAQRLASLLERIAANDKLLEQVNRKLPSDRGALLGAELAARGLQHFSTGPQNVSFVPSIMQRTCLPNFKYDEHAPLAWPRPK